VRTVFVEGVTDADVFSQAVRLERTKSGTDLLVGGLVILSSGDADRGGVNGVVRELMVFRSMARTCLLPGGQPKYRFVGLFDNDHAGRLAIRTAETFDRSIIEYKDLFRLAPTMPIHTDRDPTSLRVRFEAENSQQSGLDWELEDLFPVDFVRVFLSSESQSLIRTREAGGFVHREWTKDGKARFHRFVRENALREDLVNVVELIHAIRFYLGMTDLRRDRAAPQLR